MSSKTDRKAAKKARRNQRRQRRREASRKPGYSRAFPFQREPQGEQAPEEMQRLFFPQGA